MIPKKKADLAYGKSGSAKTAGGVGGLVKFIHKHYKKRTRLLSLDGGGYGPIEYLEEMGWLEVTELKGAGDPLSAISRIVRGWWFQDGKWQREIPPDVGALAIEGIYSMGKYIMEYLLTNPRCRLPEQPDKCAVPTEDEDLKYGFSGRSHYLFIQQRLYNFIVQSGELPFEKVLWTSTEQLGIDDETGISIPVIGPQLIGKAETANCPQWFANTFHFDNSNLSKDGKEQEFRIYMKPHRNPQNGAIYPSKLRTPPEVVHLVPSYLSMAREEDGTVPTLDTIYELEMKLKEEAKRLLGGQEK